MMNDDMTNDGDENLMIWRFDDMMIWRYDDRMIDDLMIWYDLRISGYDGMMTWCYDEMMKWWYDDMMISWYDDMMRVILLWWVWALTCWVCILHLIFRPFVWFCVPKVVVAVNIFNSCSCDILFGILFAKFGIVDNINAVVCVLIFMNYSWIGYFAKH